MESSRPSHVTRDHESNGATFIKMGIARQVQQDPARQRLRIDADARTESMVTFEVGQRWPDFTAFNDGLTPLLQSLR
ncbi:MAG TPA: hypothetical protein DCE44_25575 [Verrucomicrobiales bacterium]|nr:hypothetical protein [Verrucomicrobiales bacterium]